MWRVKYDTSWSVCGLNVGHREEESTRLAVTARQPGDTAAACCILRHRSGSKYEHK